MSEPVICFDFDGTLVDRNGRIHPNDVQILRHEDRAVFVPATGRPLHAVQHAFHENGLFVDCPIPFPMVLQNGAVLYQADEILLATLPFPLETSKWLFAKVLEYPTITCLAFSPNRVYVLAPNAAGGAMIARFSLQTELLTDGEMERSYTKITFIAETPEPLKAFVEETGTLPLERFFSLPTVLELTPPGVDKGSGLNRLLANQGWQSRHIIAAGDGENALPMFAQANVSYCPSNSPLYIQEQSDYVIQTAETGLLAPILAGLN